MCVKHTEENVSASNGVTAPTFILCCTEGAGLEDVLEFVPRVQRDYMQKYHNTEQTTQFAPFKKEQEINTSLYI